MKGYCPGDDRYVQLAPAICRWYILEAAEASTRPSAAVSSHWTTPGGFMCIHEAASDAGPLPVLI